MVRKRKYTPEFRAEAVRLVKTSDKAAAQVAKDLGVPEGTLYQWIAQGEKDTGEAPLTESERTELQRLRRENERLQMEREFLKKAAAFFAKESK